MTNHIKADEMCLHETGRSLASKLATSSCLIRNSILPRLSVYVLVLGLVVLAPSLLELLMLAVDTVSVCTSEMSNNHGAEDSLNLELPMDDESSLENHSILRKSCETSKLIKQKSSPTNKTTVFDRLEPLATSSHTQSKMSDHKLKESPPCRHHKHAPDRLFTKALDSATNCTPTENVSNGSETVQHGQIISYTESTHGIELKNTGIFLQKRFFVIVKAQSDAATFRDVSFWDIQDKITPKITEYTIENISLTPCRDISTIDCLEKEEAETLARTLDNIQLKFVGVLHPVHITAIASDCHPKYSKSSERHEETAINASNSIPSRIESDTILIQQLPLLWFASSPTALSSSIIQDIFSIFGGVRSVAVLYGGRDISVASSQNDLGEHAIRNPLPAQPLSQSAGIYFDVYLRFDSIASAAASCRLLKNRCLTKIRHGKQYYVGIFIPSFLFFLKTGGISAFVRCTPDLNGYLDDKNVRKRRWEAEREQHKCKLERERIKLELETERMRQQEEAQAKQERERQDRLAKEERRREKEKRRQERREKRELRKRLKDETAFRKEEEKRKRLEERKKLAEMKRQKEEEEEALQRHVLEQRREQLLLEQRRALQCDGYYRTHNGAIFNMFLQEEEELIKREEERLKRVAAIERYQQKQKHKLRENKLLQEEQDLKRALLRLFFVFLSPKSNRDYIIFMVERSVCKAKNYRIVERTSSSVQKSMHVQDDNTPFLLPTDGEGNGTTNIYMPPFPFV
eukprot:gene1789-4899_t